LLTLAGERVARFFLTISPDFEKIHSKGTVVAGVPIQRSRFRFSKIALKSTNIVPKLRACLSIAAPGFSLGKKTQNKKWLSFAKTSCCARSLFSHGTNELYSLPILREVEVEDAAMTLV